MDAGPISPRKSGALIGVVALALAAGWGAAWLSAADAGRAPEAEALSRSAPAMAAGAAMEAVAPLTPSAADARSESAVEPSVANPTPRSMPLRMRFVRGSTGRPAAGLAVELLADFEPSEPAAAPAYRGGGVLAAGRTDAHGWFAAPESARSRSFKLYVDAADGSLLETRPDSLRPEDLPADGSAIEVEVLGAWAHFEALVLDDSGKPVAGASVQFDFESPSLFFSTRDVPSTRATTNARGLAAIELVDPASAGGRMRIKAEAAASLLSESVELPPPLSSTRVELRLRTSARAIVRVENAAGSPLAGAMARIERLEHPFTRVGRSTDAEGTARFIPLEPGFYAASAEDPSTGSSVRTEFTIARCQVADMRLTLPPSELPLAVAGSVRWADGRPIDWLRVSISVDGREEVRLAPDSEGRFAYHRAPCERLRVRLNPAFDGPVVDPEVADVAHGSNNLLFVLSEAPRMGMTALFVVDAQTGAALQGVAAAVFRDSAAERAGGVVIALSGAALSLASDDNGLLFVPDGAQMPRAHLLVEKRGYLRRELELSEIPSLPLRDGRPSLELTRVSVQR